MCCLNVGHYVLYSEIKQCLLVLCVRGELWASLIRKEAISFLKELAENDLVLAFMVDIQRRTPNHYQLRIKGNYELSRIKKFLKDKGFFV